MNAHNGFNCYSVFAVLAPVLLPLFRGRFVFLYTALYAPPHHKPEMPMPPTQLVIPMFKLCSFRFVKRMMMFLYNTISQLIELKDCHEWNKVHNITKRFWKMRVSPLLYWCFGFNTLWASGPEHVYQSGKSKEKRNHYLHTCPDEWLKILKQVISALHPSR